MNKSNPIISIILSFRNEENNIIEIVDRLRKSLTESKINKWEFIFVNDDSKDKSKEILLNEINKDTGYDIVLVDLSRRFGVEESVYAGFKVSQGDACIYMDCDLQDPPELIPELIKKWQSDEEIEVVYTTRNKRYGEGFIKLFFTKFGYMLLNKLSFINIPQNSGDFKLISRKVVNILLENEETLPFFKGLIPYYGFKQAQIFYDRAERHDGNKNTKFPFFSFEVFDRFFQRSLISFSDAPLKLALIVGFLISLTSLFYILVVLIQKFLNMSLPGWSAIMAAVLLIGGIQLIVTGVIGLYISVIFREVKKRPNFIIKKIYKKN